jgi:DNA-binding IclR family transcriptional regulator
VLIIEEVAGDHRLTVTGNIGRTYPAWRTSTGKALLALLAPDSAGPLPGLVDRMAALEPELELIRQRGYATSYEELEAHLNAVGAPVFDHTGQAVAAVSISGPAARLPRAREREIAALVINATRAISRELGYRDML